MTATLPPPTLSYNERRVLAYITEHPGASRSGLCTHTGISVKKAGATLARLVASGRIECRAVPEPQHGTVAKRYWVRS